MSQAEQEAELRGRAREFVAGLEPEHGRIVLVRDYYLNRLFTESWEEGLRFDKEETGATADGQLRSRPRCAGRCTSGGRG